MTSVAVTGAAGPLGRRVLRLLAAAEVVDHVVAYDRGRPEVVDPDRVEHVGGDLASVDLAALAEADRVVHLAATLVEPDGRGTARVELDRVLDRARPDAGVVLVSSATVYGARRDNPVPLTEAAATRPNAGFVFAAEKLAAEQAVQAWRTDEDGAAAAILRPAPVVADGMRSWLAAQLLAAATVESADADPLTQFLHLDDLATAVVRATLDRTDGVLNVAPDGWLTGEERRALLPGQPRVRVPERVLGAARRARALVRPVVEGIDPYVTETWVVANDRMRATGWAPTWSSDEALVVAERAPRWTSLNARQRQYASLGAAGIVIGGVAGGAAYAARRLSGK